MDVKRVSLLPHRHDWTEIQRDAVTMLECHIANRGSWRRGDVERTPLTLSHIQWWLRKTGARRSGRDYARDVLRELVQMQFLKTPGKFSSPVNSPARASTSTGGACSRFSLSLARRKQRDGLQPRSPAARLGFAEEQCLCVDGFAVKA